MTQKNECNVQMFSSRACEVGTKGCETKHELEEVFIECKCGKKWWIDYVATQDQCVEDVWRIWVDGIPGKWMDVDGNLV